MKKESVLVDLTEAFDSTEELIKLFGKTPLGGNRCPEN